MKVIHKRHNKFNFTFLNAITSYIVGVYPTIKVEWEIDHSSQTHDDHPVYNLYISGNLRIKILMVPVPNEYLNSTLDGDIKTAIDILMKSAMGKLQK